MVAQLALRPDTADAGFATRSAPVKVWGAVGVFWLAVIAYCWSAWLLSGDARPTPKGPVPVPTWMKISIHSWEVVTVIVLAFVVQRFVIRPWRRERRLSFDGMLVIALLTTWMTQDPLLNYSGQWFNYNSEFLNLGCPQCHLPGWQAPGRAVMTEPIVFAWGMYGSYLFGTVVFVNWLMRKAKERRPQLGVVGLFGVALSAYVVIDVIVETIWIRTGAWTYPGAIGSVSVFAGRYYQFPLYEPIMLGVVLGPLAAFRYFRNDKGETIAERGIDDLRVTNRQRMGIRLLAVIGAVQMIFLLYNVPAQWVGLRADNFPQDTLNRPYLTNMMCGPGTAYACPGPRVPNVRGPDSAHVTPDGTMVAPSGLPVQKVR